MGAADGCEAELAQLVDGVRRMGKKPVCSVLGDTRDPHWKRLAEDHESSRLMGLWRVRRRMKIAVTGVPTGLEPAEQALFATAPFLMPLEFLPFHAGRIMLI